MVTVGGGGGGREGRIPACATIFRTSLGFGGGRCCPLIPVHGKDPPSIIIRVFKIVDQFIQTFGDRVLVVAVLQLGQGEDFMLLYKDEEILF